MVCNLANYIKKIKAPIGDENYALISCSQLVCSLIKKIKAPIGDENPCEELMLGEFLLPLRK